MTPDVTLCANHDCPAIHSCSRYAGYHIAKSSWQSYFKPSFDPKRVPPCSYYSEWRDDERRKG